MFCSPESTDGLYYAGIAVSSITINNEENNMKLSKQQEKHLSGDAQQLIKAGLMKTNLKLTDEGEQALTDILLDKYEVELLKKADKIILKREEK